MVKRCRFDNPGATAVVLPPKGDPMNYEFDEDFTDPYDDDRIQFADPGGRSALRAASPDNPRNLSCPSCGEPDRLTPADRARGYQCNACADRDEGVGY